MKGMSMKRASETHMKAGRLLSAVLSLVMVIVCLPTISRADGYSYVDENGDAQTVETAQVIDSSTTALTSGWYILDSDVTISNHVLTVDGDVKLILSDGCTLTMNTTITGLSGSTLTIYGQSEGDYGSGKLQVGNNHHDNVLIDTAGDLNIFGGIIAGAGSDSNGHLQVRGDLAIARASVTLSCHGNHKDHVIDCVNLTVQSGFLSINASKGCGLYCLNKEKTAGKVLILDGTVSVTGTSNHPVLQTHELEIKGGDFTLSDKQKGGIEASAVSLSWSKPTDRIDLTHVSHITLNNNGKVSFERPFWVGNSQHVPSDNVELSAVYSMVLTPSHDPFIAGHSLTLEEGRIGMNFFVYEPSDQEGTMSFSISGKGSVTQKSGYVTRDVYRVYTCYVSSIQMADTITASYSCDGKSVTDPYSVKEYLTYLDEHASEYSEKMITLVHAIADYGHYGQLYLKDRNGWTFDPDTGYAPMNTYYASSFDQEKIMTTIPNSAITHGSGIVKVSYQLYFDSAITLNIFFTVEDGQTFTCEGAEDMGNGKWKVTRTGISATELDQAVTVSGTCGGNFSVSISPLTYVKAVLKSSSTSSNAKNAVSAFYMYYEAAKAYAGNQGGH